MIAALAGMGVGLGALAIVVGLRTPPSPRTDLRVRGRRPASGTSLARAGGALAAAGGAYALTGWPVGAVLAGTAAGLMPLVLRESGARRSHPERAEAVAGWAEMLRDTMAASAGIEQAVLTTAPLAPIAIRPQAEALARRLGHERLVPALGRFADDLDDPTADLVVSALVLASEHPARDLGALLGALATSARAEAAMVLRVEAGRARLRTASRVVTATTVGFGGLLVLTNRSFLTPYDDALGQAWLLLVGLLFAAAIWQLQRMARLATPPRLLAPGAGVHGVAP